MLISEPVFSPQKNIKIQENNSARKNNFNEKGKNDASKGKYRAKENTKNDVNFLKKQKQSKSMSC